MSRPIRFARRRAFTLMDVTITALIIGILAGVTSPRLLNTLDDISLQAAAQQVAADLRYARRLAKMRGKNQSVTFTPASDTYELNGVSDLNRSSRPFIVVLPTVRYGAAIDSAAFGVGSVVTFDMYGKPNNGGSVVVSRRGATKTVLVDATTGEVQIP